MDTIKPGKKTSEFIVTLAPWIIILGLLVLVGLGRADLTDLQWLMVALGLSGGFASGKYSESRGMVKSATPLPIIEETEE